ncbi:hypothetical protein V8F66_15930 [Vreelandella sp. SM1641]|uniref:Uncharacterized protein n=1 Tax=Vreelandella sp. SM1641 TaxID=3126101 RepID=A0AAU7XW33_9GAMM
MGHFIGAREEIQPLRVGVRLPKVVPGAVTQRLQPRMQAAFDRERSVAGNVVHHLAGGGRLERCPGRHAGDPGRLPLRFIALLPASGFQGLAEKKVLFGMAFAA